MKCTLCRLSQTAKTNCLGGLGPRRSKVMVVGEAPGRREDEEGVPFVGSSGRLLHTVLGEAGVEDYYTTYAVRCHPPTKAPTKGEIKKCSSWLQEEVSKVKPKFVLLMGNVPLMSITGRAGIKKSRGRPFERDGIIYLPTYSPSFVLRDERHRAPFEADIAIFAEIVRTGGIPRENNLDWTIVDTEDKVTAMLKALKGTVSYDLETTGLHAWETGAKVVSIGFGTRGKQWCLPVFHRESPWSGDDIARILARIDRRLRDCFIVAHNGKFDAVWMRVHFDLDWKPDFDTMLAHYMVDENQRHGLKLLAQLYYGAPNYDVDGDEKRGEGPLYQHCWYLAHDVYYTRRLRFTLGKLLARDPGVQRVFKHLLMPCSDLFIEVAINGVYINVARMQEVEKHLKQQLAEASKELAKYGDINWGSPKQLSKLLYEDLKLPILEKTKTGAPSSSESVLLRLDHPIASNLLKWRRAKKNLGTFIEGWKGFLDKNNRLHPNFKLHGTVTGRPSCADPNLQQVPRDPIIRSLISAPAGYVLIEVDLSQAELRIAAELSRDPVLMYAYDHGLDAHWMTAMREIERAGAMKEEVIATARKHTGKKLRYAEAIEVLKEMHPDEAAAIHPGWKNVRKKAKAVNFGYLYGMWWKKFKIYARDNYGVVVTDKQAQDSRKAFFELYRGLPKWHERQRRYARRNGYVRALSGRKRRLPNAMLPHDCPERGDAERQAINSPVQCFASELNLMTALQLHREFPEVRIAGTVHDAILFEVPEDRVQTVVNRTLKIMEHPDLLDTLDVKLRVPIEGEAKVGPWGTGKDLDEWLSSSSVSQR